MSFRRSEETYQFLEDLARNKGWSIQEAVRIIIDEGVASIRTGETSQKFDGVSGSEKVIRLLSMLKDADSDYAALKFQNYVFSRDNKTLEMNLAGYRGKIESLEMYVGELKEKIARSKCQQPELSSD